MVTGTLLLMAELVIMEMSVVDDYGDNFKTLPSAFQRQSLEVDPIPLCYLAPASCLFMGACLRTISPGIILGVSDQDCCPMLTLRHQSEPTSNVHLFPALSWAQHVVEGAAIAMMEEEQGDTCKDAAADRTWWQGRRDLPGDCRKGLQPAGAPSPVSAVTL